MEIKLIEIKKIEHDWKNCVDIAGHIKDIEIDIENLCLIIIFISIYYTYMVISTKIIMGENYWKGKKSWFNLLLLEEINRDYQSLIVR